MRYRSGWPILLAALLWVAGCGGGSGDQASHEAQGDSPATVAIADSMANEDGLHRQDDHYQRRYPEMGFAVTWPPSCGQLLHADSPDTTRLAFRETINTCEQDSVTYWVRCLKSAHDIEGAPAHPRLVLALSELLMDELAVRPLRQRPIKRDGFEGIDVHAIGRDGPREIWIRALLAGENIYMMTVRHENGGLFTDAKAEAFLDSFELIQP